MTQQTSGLYAVLSHPKIYSGFQYLMGARRGWQNFVAEFIRPSAHDAILDIGCGPGDLLEYLPETDYWGFDISQAYIEKAQKKFQGRGQFHCKILTAKDLECMPKFDIVVASGVLHHLSDEFAAEFFDLAHLALKPGGRLVTVDPCLEKGQHPVARFLIKSDRGRNVRWREGYELLASRAFPDTRVQIRHKAWIPYTHCFMECTK